MNRADPFFERDATGWQMIDIETGRIALHYNLYNNENRTVAFDPKTGDEKWKAFSDRGNYSAPIVIDQAKQTAANQWPVDQIKGS